MKSEIELTRKEIATHVTVKVSVDKALKSFRWRIPLATFFFKIGQLIMGCNLEVDLGEYERRTDS